MRLIANVRRPVTAISLFAILILRAAKASRRWNRRPPRPRRRSISKWTRLLPASSKERYASPAKRPARKPIDMSEEPACVEAHHGKAYDESLVVNPNGTLANVFVYIKGGLEGKTFEVPATPVVIDQQGCWFHPRVLGIQTGQVLSVVNSDPVTHNIHPLAQINREWNHSQGQGDPPLGEKIPQAGNHDSGEVQHPSMDACLHRRRRQSLLRCHRRRWFVRDSQPSAG